MTFEVVEEAPRSDEALEAARRLRPDIALLSSSRPTVANTELPSELTGLDQDQPVKVILLAAPHHADALTALSVGCRGVLSTGGSPRELLHAIRLVAAGDACVAPAFIRSVLGDFRPDQTHTEADSSAELEAPTRRPRRGPPPQLPLGALTRSSNTEIADELSLSGLRRGLFARVRAQVADKRLPGRL
ncbi:MAG: hypothetical protein ACRDZO_15355 [Egibacteraceae bacterium]